MNVKIYSTQCFFCLFVFCTEGMPSPPPSKYRYFSGTKEFCVMFWLFSSVKKMQHYTENKWKESTSILRSNSKTWAMSFVNVTTNSISKKQTQHWRSCRTSLYHAPRQTLISAFLTFSTTDSFLAWDPLRALTRTAGCAVQGAEPWKARLWCKTCAIGELFNVLNFKGDRDNNEFKAQTEFFWLFFFSSVAMLHWFGYFGI